MTSRLEKKKKSERKMHTPTGQVLEVKNKSLRKIGISQGNGMCALWGLPQTGIFHSGDDSFWGRKSKKTILRETLRLSVTPAGRLVQYNNIQGL